MTDPIKAEGLLAQAVFTPGPWRTTSWMHQRSAPKIHVESTDKGSGYARICTLTPRNNGPAIDANAALIAAAPDLHAALRAICAAFAYTAPEYLPGAALKAFALVEAALAKAEGRSAAEPPSEKSP